MFETRQRVSFAVHLRLQGGVEGNETSRSKQMTGPHPRTGSDELAGRQREVIGVRGEGGMWNVDGSVCQKPTMILGTSRQQPIQTPLRRPPETGTPVNPQTQQRYKQKGTGGGCWPRYSYMSRRPFFAAMSSFAQDSGLAVER